MKIAFLCEGHSEHESITLILQKLGIYKFRYLARWNEPVPNDDNLYVLRHNYRNVNLIENQYFAFSEILIEKAGYTKVFVWFDSKRNFPVCEFAKTQYALINEKYRGRIELLIAIRSLENWYISNAQVLSCMSNATVDENYLRLKGIDNFLNDENVDLRNAKKILFQLRAGTEIECFTKPKVATRFFHCLRLDVPYRSESLSRFLNKIQGHLTTIN